jgi:hypothetical protein
MIEAPSAAPRAMRDQNLKIISKEQTQRTRNNKILKDIKKLKDSYNQNKNRDAKIILYGITARLFQKMKD